MAAPKNTEILFEIDGEYYSNMLRGDEQESDSDYEDESDYDAELLSAPPNIPYLVGVDNNKLFTYDFDHFPSMGHHASVGIYDQNRDTWDCTEFENAKNNFNEIDAAKTMIFDQQDKSIWAYLDNHDGTPSKLINIMSDDTKVRYAEIEIQEFSGESFPQMLWCGNFLHVVGGCNQYNESGTFRHAIFNKKTGNVTYKQYTSSDLEGHDGFFIRNSGGFGGFVLSKATNHLYLFGENYPAWPAISKLYRFSLEQEQWEVLHAGNMKAVGMDFDGACKVGSTDGKYIFIIRGQDANRDNDVTQRTNNIIVYDVEQNVFRTSSLQLPYPTEYDDNGFAEPSTVYDGYYTAVVLRDQKMESLLGFGYIRKQYATSEFQGLPLMPAHMMKLVSQWVCIDFIHVVENCKPDGQHFRVGIKQIMDSLE